MPLELPILRRRLDLRQTVQKIRSFNATSRERQSPSMARQSLWIVVSGVILCSALATGINTNPNALNCSSTRPTAATAAESAQAANRIYNRIGLGTCLLCLIINATEMGWSRRAFRVLKSPVVWAVGYQAIYAWHYLSNDDLWDMARLCGGWLLLMVAMAASSPMPLDRYVHKMRFLFRLLLWMSLVVGIVLPNNGWYHDYEATFIPWIHDRFAGIGGQPNGMGAIAGIAVLMELDQFLGRGAKKRLNILHLGLGAALLLLTQSKTSMIACALCVLYVLSRQQTRVFSQAVQVMAAVSAALVGCLVAWLSLGDWVASNRESLSALSGRVQLWDYYWALALERPWFGYGTSLWSDLRQMPSFQFGWAAGNAHNQLFSFLLNDWRLWNRAFSSSMWLPCYVAEIA